MEFHILNPHGFWETCEKHKDLNPTFWLAALLRVPNAWSKLFQNSHIIIHMKMNPTAWNFISSWTLINRQKNRKNNLIPLSNIMYFFGPPIHDPNHPPMFETHHCLPEKVFEALEPTILYEKTKYRSFLARSPSGPISFANVNTVLPNKHGNRKRFTYTLHCALAHLGNAKRSP